ncbi:Holliday junction branch migration protein RuvA [Balneatrix alpica]|uniref:Holliday junction branch migration complex subunit RuvA n=1 Tax=Balneatrix alpica TaxID=75684 RepID=A0ABV5Z6Q9_9GAMM|nr:Holliday junction branch migration protein RuvA [Balneatrix alpica]
MIGRLEGIILEKQPPQLLVDVAGVGYEVEASMQTHFRLPERGKKVVLYTHHLVREDAQLLYGFVERQERDLFRVLIKVNGVGPKLALAILSTLNIKELVTVVHHQDVQRLVKVPGVGKKTAERLLVELRDRLDGWLELQEPEHFSLQAQGVEVQLKEPDMRMEAEQALLALGYKPAEASRLLMQAEKQLPAEQRTLEALIKQALKMMAAG